MPVKTRRPDMTGLSVVLNAVGMLHGERNGIELPIPTSAIRDYAKRFKLSEIFVSLVRAYDGALMSGMRNIGTSTKT